MVRLRLLKRRLEGPRVYREEKIARLTSCPSVKWT